jgi:hypothetical protein
MYRNRSPARPIMYQTRSSSQCLRRRLGHSFNEFAGPAKAQ